MPADPTLADPVQKPLQVDWYRFKSKRRQRIGRAIFSFTQLGARLSPLESSLALAVPLGFLQSSALRAWFLWNLRGQLILISAVALLPALITRQMRYIDIAWPAGLVLLGFNGYTYGTGLSMRKFLMASVLCMHGGRMLFGALLLFFPYKFEVPLARYAVARGPRRTACRQRCYVTSAPWQADLPRYQYARWRFVEKLGMPDSLWPAKMVHDILQQAFANCAILAAPVALTSFDETAKMSWVELAGYALWLGGFLWESAADTQKMRFVKASRAAMREAKFAAADSAAAPPQQHTVLGLKPYAGWKYCCWAACRHPNYFGEWMAWNGIVLAALPSLLRLKAPPLVRVAMALATLLVSRLMYDCLLYWTGAEPAEHFSAQKRTAYADYQRCTRVFWPFELPFTDHGRRAGWPAPLVKGKAAAEAGAKGKAAAGGKAAAAKRKAATPKAA